MVYFWLGSYSSKLQGKGEKPLKKKNVLDRVVDVVPNNNHIMSHFH